MNGKTIHVVQRPPPQAQAQAASSDGAGTSRGLERDDRVHHEANSFVLGSFSLPGEASDPTHVQVTLIIHYIKLEFCCKLREIVTSLICTKMGVWFGIWHFQFKPLTVLLQVTFKSQTDLFMGVGTRLYTSELAPDYFFMGGWGLATNSHRPVSTNLYSLVRGACLRLLARNRAAMLQIHNPPITIPEAYHLPTHVLYNVFIFSIQNMFPTNVLWHRKSIWSRIKDDKPHIGESLIFVVSHSHSAHVSFLSAQVFKILIFLFLVHRTVEEIPLVRFQFSAISQATHSDCT